MVKCCLVCTAEWEHGPLGWMGLASREDMNPLWTCTSRIVSMFKIRMYPCKELKRDAPNRTLQKHLNDSLGSLQKKNWLKRQK